ncbi:hypothetical protein [Sodalis-like endosymbiont of Proechinophthirus fluctus]|nr:hypothetical protein [Sodalis-like endosymbiont of Proechinophthirus fluctus]
MQTPRGLALFLFLRSTMILVLVVVALAIILAPAMREPSALRPQRIHK